MSFLTSLGIHLVHIHIKFRWQRKSRKRYVLEDRGSIDKGKFNFNFCSHI